MKKIMKIIPGLRRKYHESKVYADKMMYWKSLARKVAPAMIQEQVDNIFINKTTLCRCIIVGVPHFGQVGYPKQLSARLIDELLSLSSAGFTIAYSFTVIPIEPSNSMRMLDDALYYNDVNQVAYKKSNNQASHEIELDRTEYLELYSKLHKGEQKLFHTAMIVVIWGTTEEEISTGEGMVKSHSGSQPGNLRSAHVLDA